MLESTRHRLEEKERAEHFSRRLTPPRLILPQMHHYTLCKQARGQQAQTAKRIVVVVLRLLFHHSFILAGAVSWVTHLKERDNLQTARQGVFMLADTPLCSLCFACVYPSLDFVYFIATNTMLLKRAYLFSSALFCCVEIIFGMKKMRRQSPCNLLLRILLHKFMNCNATFFINEQKKR